MAVRSRSLDFGRMRVWGSIAVVLSNVCAGWAFDRAGIQMLPLLVAVLLFLPAAVAPLLPTDRHLTTVETGSSGRWRDVLADRPLMRAMVAASLIMGSHGVLTSFSAIQWAAHGIATSTIGLLQALAVSAEIVAFWFGTKLLGRRDPRILLCIAAVAAALRWIVMASNPGVPVLIATQLLQGVTATGAILGMMLVIAARVPVQSSAAAQGLNAVLLGVILAVVTAGIGAAVVVWRDLCLSGDGGAGGAGRGVRVADRGAGARSDGNRTDVRNGSGIVTRSRILTVLLAASLAGPALAQTAPAPASAPEHNILTWPMPQTVSPQGRAVAEALARAPLPNPLPPIALQRQFIDSLQASFGGQLEKRYDVRVETTTMAGVPVRIVYPKGVTAIGKGPVLLNLHGGGFQLDSGSLTETVPIAALTGVPVVAVLYRLSPENAYPAALDDALAVYQALEKDRPASKIAVFGTSAGAVLSGELIARLTSLHKPMPAALGFLSGSADLSTSGDSESWAPLPTGDRSLAASIRPYIAATAPTDPVLSPIHGDISGFPPTLLLSSTRDILLSPTAIFARALTEHGVDARLIVFDGLPHAFWSYMDIPETVQADTLVADFLKARLGVTPPKRR